MAVQAEVAHAQTPNREQVAEENKWAVTSLYPSWEAWEADFSKWGREGAEMRWPELLAFKEGWKGSAEQLASLIKTYVDIDRNLSKLYTYAHLRHDEDVAEEVSKKAYVRAISSSHALAQEASWIEPMLLSMDEGHLREVLSSPTLKDYKFHLEKIVRLKPHTLSAEQEELLALSGKALDASSQAFSAFNNADLKFSPAIDAQGKERELTHGKYLVYLRDQDRALRESAFKNLHKAFFAYENTLAEMLSGQVQRHLFEAKARKYSSCLEAALFPHQIDTTVYRSLIQAVRKHLPALHRYMHLRRQIMNVDKLHLYDLHVPLVKQMDMKMDYDSAADAIISAVSPLGAEYQRHLSKGLKEQRWVDRYENQRKRSGAYSSGCYDSLPYILMNYHGQFHDAMTLAHEAGHSMHSFLSRSNQPYQYANYSIFVAEVASTFHEELLLHHFLRKAKTPQEKAFLINQKLDDMRATLLRQTCFAEFELKIHELAEQGVPLTPTLLKSEYRKLSQEYYGPDVYIDEESDIEWARIPHFYYNFYVYQYATGISAAQALVERVTHGGEKERKDYLSFLSAGSSVYPIDALKMAGVDMRNPEVVESAMRHFDKLVGELEELCRR
ncbi:MAG: Oligoendopeptidase [Chlamydiota bacterium]|jgi:oligoendopeptidase F